MDGARDDLDDVSGVYFLVYDNFHSYRVGTHMLRWPVDFVGCCYTKMLASGWMRLKNNLHKLIGKYIILRSELYIFYLQNRALICLRMFLPGGVHGT